MKKTSNNEWHQKMWLPAAAGVYLIICIFDFIIMPVYVAAHNSRVETIIFQKIDKEAITTISESLIKGNQALKQWNPLTLMGAGMFHLAFGALLTGGAVTRGFAKKSEIEGYYRYGAAGYEAQPQPEPEYDDQYASNPPYIPNRVGGYNGNQNQRFSQRNQSYSDVPDETSDSQSLRPPKD